jgi:signal transduction histidine kinase
VGRHARASRVDVRIAREPDRVVLTVRDDGVGFDPATVGMHGGLQNMADRISAAGGTLRVESVPGGGTSVLGSIPQGAP